jgi:hypothetical protein
LTIYLLTSNIILVGHFSRNCPNPKPVAEAEDEYNFSGGYNSFGGDANNGDFGTAPTEDFGSVGGFRQASKPAWESESKPARESKSKPAWETDAGAGGDTWGSGKDTNLKLVWRGDMLTMI